MLAQRRPDEQVYVGPTSFSNVGPTESTTEKQCWPNVVMLSGTLAKEINTEPPEDAYLFILNNVWEVAIPYC